MFFTKYPHPANFSFAESFDKAAGSLAIGERSFDVSLTGYEGDIYHLQVSKTDLWPPNRCLEPLKVPHIGGKRRVKLTADGSFRLNGRDGSALLSSAVGRFFGVSGETSLFQISVGADARFFGMGEKTFGRIELSGIRTKFWNTDVWGDFHFGQWGEHPVDPPYFSIPYVAVRQGDEWVGLLLHNPSPTFMETPGSEQSRVFVEWQRTSQNLLLGSEGGEPNLWVVYGPSLQELTRKLQALVGLTPRPPAWALGYHQSRWGYKGHDDLLEMDAEFRRHELPCDSLWLDLDYMDGFRIFNTSKEMFPEGVQATADALAENGRRIVPILDPGVKFEAGYDVYDDGHQQAVFCLNEEGREFVGMVWPGETVFPDFTQENPRHWWAGKVQEFAAEGFGACWLDMNDPSTGPVDPNGMLFKNGTESHAAHRNQYALGMQMATHAGFLKARPNERPFMLSRSGFIGSSNYSAIWTGDNVSNYTYLAQSIPTAVGMSISGQPFSGPDIGGFGGDADADLMSDWVKCGFLFPFMRNHSTKDSRRQEPFAYSAGVLDVLRRYIRLRYKFFPYLYNLFIDQEQHGDPILRPLFYHFPDKELELVNDQFLIGPSILQAPFVAEDQKSRTVVLPGTAPWYDAATGDWVEPGTVTVKRNRFGTPLYFAAGSLIPLQPGTPTDSRKEVSKVHLHLFVPNAWTGETEIVYRADDGLSFDYRTGAQSELQVRVVSADGHVAIATKTLGEGFGPITPTFVIHGQPRSVRLEGKAMTETPAKVTFSGKPLAVTVLG